MKLLYTILTLMALYMFLRTPSKESDLVPKFVVGDRVLFTPADDYPYHQCYNFGRVEEIEILHNQVIYVIQPKSKKPYDCTQEVISEKDVRYHESMIDYDKAELQ